MPTARALSLERKNETNMIAFMAAIVSCCAMIVVSIWLVCMFALSSVSLSNAEPNELNTECPGSLLYGYVVICMCLTLLEFVSGISAGFVKKESPNREFGERIAVTLCACVSASLFVFGMYEVFGRGCQSTEVVHWRLYVAACLWVFTHFVGLCIAILYGHRVWRRL